MKRFEVSGPTYPLTVAYLKNNYDDKEALIQRLLYNLQFARAHLDDQEALCELDSIVSQLKSKGEHVDNVFLRRQLINKLSPKVPLLLIAKEYIKGELRVTRQMKQWTICDTSKETSCTPYGSMHRKH
ncbi:unnamed protein product [Haemonchus placei]|uniref:GINS complex subunit 1 n=1 Tax=Haemonchus placei TaxID=6290 RepID=A0A0N4X2L7_HAEPC|nr:unnamed protein product [Haemonchus placei]